MATWDVADVLARAKRKMNRPTSDNIIADADWYAWFTEGQHYWMRELSVYSPESNATMELMTTGDSGITWTAAAEPLGNLVVKKSRTSSYPMVPGSEWDVGADYVDEGRVIRFANNRVPTFTDGPYAYYTKAPGVVDGSTAFVMKPDFARILVACYACIEAARRLKVPVQPWEEDMARQWSGNGRDSGGILTMLKTRQKFGGASTAGNAYRWWRPNG